MPRADGQGWLSVKARDGQSVLDRFRTRGALKMLFPVRTPRAEAILINTAGGLTGGDRLQLSVEVQAGAHLTMTTQAAERVYRAREDTARVTSDITVGAGAHLSWLPQELIVYEGGALDRRLAIDLDASASLLMVEPVIFGRRAMAETLRAGHLSDRIRVSRAGRPLYLDGTELHGDIAATLARRALGQGAGAMASLLYVAPDAGAHLDALRAALRAALPATGGASLLAPDTLALRCLAEDGFALRAALLPILDRLSRDTLPASWRL
ncbi:urease accessory protein [Roseivivax lentus]|uniref:Urease accessory protein UreD n=1 Tax=Roseivivax lentus TaxID=633194 RepID=A0A1N7P0Q6_9RHOB|nr:urease accessory protein UreD [Roseivivax lentus]SIT04019.1 urease accessory protein [Roseivivax lentus]